MTPIALPSLRSWKVGQRPQSMTSSVDLCQWLHDQFGVTIVEQTQAASYAQ
jgi:hypothetical protein